MNRTLITGSHAGLRNLLAYHSVCLDCLAAGRPAQNVGPRHASGRRSQRDRLCLTCSTEWSISHCWSCQTHWVDSRDPQTQPCLCGWLKCAACGACDWHGCRQHTNPYHNGFTYRDDLLRPVVRFAASEDDPKDKYDWQDDADSDWQDDADSGWQSYVGVSRDDPDWDMMEEIAADAMFERSERD